MSLLNSKRKHHVLLVEDDRMQRLVVCQLLRACHYSVTIAENGETALRLLRSDKMRLEVDLVLTDVRMPKVDGCQLIQELKKNDMLRDTPVVVMSSNDKPGDIASLIGIGAVEYCVKPVQPAILRSLSRHVVPRQRAPPPPPKAAPMRSSPPRTASSGESGHEVLQYHEPADCLLAAVKLASTQSSRSPASAAPNAPTQQSQLVKAAPAGNPKKRASECPPERHVVRKKQAVQLKQAEALPVAPQGASKGDLGGNGKAVHAPATAMPPAAGAVKPSTLPSLGPRVKAPAGTWQCGMLQRPHSSFYGYQSNDSVPISTPSIRKAALERFRLKKAKRDYSKTVRYEARKKLAEKRPRHKGQFIKMMKPEHPAV